MTTCYFSMTVLPELRGRAWDVHAEAMLSVLRPSSVRVVPHNSEEKSDHRPWRVTVRLDMDSCIDVIEQEVECLCSSKWLDGQQARAWLKGKR